MPLATLRQVLDEAAKGGYGVGAFNANNMEQVQGIVAAAQEVAAPVIIHRSRRLGRQIINDAGGYSVRHRLFSEVELNEAKAMATGKTVEATAV